MEADHYKDWHR